MNRLFSFFQGLRGRVALIVALPVFITLTLVALSNYQRERSALLSQLDSTALHLGDVMRGSLRHSMLTRDLDQMQRMLEDIGMQKEVLRVGIFNDQARLILSNDPNAFDSTLTKQSPGCIDCHALPDVKGKTSLVLSLNDGMVLRTGIAIPNEKECYGCHDSSRRILGMLVADFSLIDLESHALDDLGYNLIVSLFVTLLITFGIYAWIHFFVVKRVESFDEPLRRFAEGDFTARVPSSGKQLDELSRLKVAFNRMAEDLQQHEQLVKQTRTIREAAITEERRRLARELHDSTAQLLSYVSNKAGAVRLLIQQGKIDDATAELNNLDEAARAVFADLRQAILDLKTNVDEERDLASTLSEYVVNFERYSDIPTSIAFKDVDELRLPHGHDLQVLRIVQEALANVRKHAQARSASVIVAREGDDQLTITIRDDGIGFDSSSDPNKDKQHFGLVSMAERAGSIGASFSVESIAGQGTEVRLRLKLDPQGDSQ